MLIKLYLLKLGLILNKSFKNCNNKETPSGENL
jgi:hypothetical protein